MILAYKNVIWNSTINVTSYLDICHIPFIGTELQHQTAAEASIQNWHAPPFRHFPAIVGPQILSRFTARSLAGLMVNVRLAAVPVKDSRTCIPICCGLARRRRLPRSLHKVRPGLPLNRIKCRTNKMVYVWKTKKPACVAGFAIRSSRMFPSDFVNWKVKRPDWILGSSLPISSASIRFFLKPLNSVYSTNCEALTIIWQEIVKKVTVERSLLGADLAGGIDETVLLPAIHFVNLL